MSLQTHMLNYLFVTYKSEYSLYTFWTQLDKATLLGEVIRHLKDLKTNAAQASEGLMIPKNNDKIRVEEGGFLHSVLYL